MRRKTILSVLLVYIILFTSCSKIQNARKDYVKKENYSLIKGINAQDQGKTEEALKNFLDAYSQNPTNEFTLKQIAYIYSEIGEENKAEEFYLKILDKTPDEGITLHNLGILYYKQKNYEKSLEKLSQIPKKSMNNEIIKLKIYNYYLLKNYEAAYLESQDIIEEEQDDLQFSIIYATALFKQRKINELHLFITELYNQNLEVYPIIDIYARHLWENLGETEKAVSLYKNYIIKYGPEKEAVLGISKLFYEEEDYEEAKKYISLILEKNMFDQDVLILKAKIYRKNGLIKEAERIEELLPAEKE